MNDQQKVMELVVFKLKAGADIKIFKAAASELNQVLKKEIPGYLDRSLLHTPDGDQWVDVVYWSSMELALGAMKYLEARVEFQSFCTWIDMQQTSMYHLVPATI